MIKLIKQVVRDALLEAGFRATYDGPWVAFQIKPDVWAKIGFFSEYCTVFTWRPLTEVRFMYADRDFPDNLTRYGEQL